MMIASQAMLEGLEVDLRPLAHPLLPWLALRHEAGSFLGPGRPLAALVSLNLHNRGLRRIEGPVGLRDNLRELVLTYNEISRVEGVSELTGLQWLDLGHNCLKKVEGIKGLAALVHLDLSSNQVRCCCCRRSVP